MPRRKFDGPNRFGDLSASGDRNRKLYVRIAEQMSDTLMKGSYARGDRLPAERDLAQHFGVSRPTMREALLALEVQGLLELRKSTGITVTLNGPRATFVPDSDTGALDLMKARRLFEGEVAALAALNVTDEGIAELAQALHGLAAQTDGDAEAPFRTFHVLASHICANNVTVTCIHNLWASHRGDPRLYALLDRAARIGRDTWLLQHERIFAAIAARDPNAARSAMNAFSDQAIGHLRQAIQAIAFESQALVVPGQSPRSARRAAHG